MFLTTRCAGCDEPGVDLCRRCRFALAASTATMGDGGVAAAMPFDGVGRQVLLGLKYANRRRVAGRLAELMVRRLHLDAVHLDVVTWAPTSRRRARERGFDQAELLARSVARRLGVPSRRLLRRTGPGTGTQTGRSRSERLAAPRFAAHPGAVGSAVLVLDDVVTSGATLAAARDALVAAGAGRVHLAAAAATPHRQGARGGAGVCQGRIASPR